MKYVESYTIELKQEVNADFKKEIIAFANSEGGEIFVGVSRDGTIVGVSDAERVMEQIGNMIRDGIKPDLTAYTSIAAVNDEDRTVVKITVLRGAKRPYHLSDKGRKPNGVFIRHGVSSVPATDEMIREMLRESDGVTFDKSRCINQELTFLYADQYFAKAHVPFEESNKRTLKLLDPDGYYTNTALLLSDQCEHSIKCAVYEGTGKTKFKTRKEFFGSVLKQVDEAYEFLSLNNNLNSTIEGLKRTDHPDYPPYALREALMNTIIHRDYDYSGSTLINIYDDRIEFVSLGGLVKGLTIKDVMGGVSQSRNMVLANIFYRLELIESYGTGIQRIMESYADYPDKPVFAPAPASFVVVLPKIISVAHDGESNSEKALRFIQRHGEVSRKEIEAVLGSSKFPAICALNELIAEKKIIKTGSGPAVRYRLSE